MGRDGEDVIMNSPESAYLDTFVPQELKSSISLQEDLAPVVGRLANVLLSGELTTEEFFTFFSSKAQETRVPKFPYFRVDIELQTMKNYLAVINAVMLSGRTTQEKNEIAAEKYILASRKALNIIAWVEVGFLGLEYLAVSPASKNWTMAVGLTASDEERAKGIMGGGKDFYTQRLREFVRYRTQNNIKDDVFTQMGIESWLTPFQGMKG